MSAAPGRKSIVRISQGFPARLVLGNKIFDSTVNAFNDANVALYGVESRGLAEVPRGQSVSRRS